MYKQYEYVRESAALVRNQTYRLDLPKSGILSALMLKLTCACTSGATLADPSWRLLDFLDSIQVIANGATVIKALSGKHLHFLNWLRQGIVPPHFWRNYATNTQFEYLPILFGRYIGDPQYALDLSRFDQVELKVSFTGTATYYSADGAISIMQTFLREGNAGLQGYLRSELWRQWTTVQNETQYLVLPTEFPFSGIYLRALPHTTLGMSDTGFVHLMEDVDFSQGGGTKQMYKGGLDDLTVMNYLEQGKEIITSGIADVTADRGISTGVGRMFGFAGISGSKDGAVSAVIPTMIADATDNTISFEAREADSPVEFIVRGMGFHNMGYLLHSPNLSPDEMLEPRTTGELRLNITTENAAASAGGTNEVVIERVVP